MSKVVDFRKDIRAALAARAKELKTTLAAMTPEQLNQELTALMNDENWQNKFSTQQEFATQFHIAFKKELMVVGEFLNVPADKMQAVANLEDVATEEAPAADATPAEAPAAEEPSFPFYAVEFRGEQNVGIGFEKVEMARAYSRRRNKEGVITQTATASQWAERGQPGAMLTNLDLNGRPYVLGEMVEPVLAEPAAAPKKEAKVIKMQVEPGTVSIASDGTKKTRVAGLTPAAPVEPTPAPEAAKEAPKPAPAAAPAGQLLPAPVVKRKPLPGADAPVQEQLNARLGHLDKLEDFTALVAEIQAAGLALFLKSRNKPVELLSHNPSGKYEQVTCMSFKYAGQEGDKEVSKSYLHVLPRYYEVKPEKKAK